MCLRPAATIRKGSAMFRSFIISVIACLAALSSAVTAATTVDWIVANSHAKVAPSKAQRIVNEAISAGSRHGIDPVLILAVMRMESGYRAKVVSSEGATCMMQVMPRYHREKIAGRDLNDLRVCVDVGTRILKEYLVLCRGDMRRALTRYSGGDRRYASAVLAWKARIVLETRDAGGLTVASAGQ